MLFDREGRLLLSKDVYLGDHKHGTFLVDSRALSLGFFLFFCQEQTKDTLVVEIGVANAQDCCRIQEIGEID